jgi:HK97 family phage prohead protease
MTRALVSKLDFRRIAGADGAAVGVEVVGAKMLRQIGPDSARTLRFVLSDGSIDRVGDTIAVGGWQLGSYKRNPVVLFAHDSLNPPIGRMTNVHSDGARLVGDVEFAAPEVYEFADTVFRMTKEGFINAGSVGFLPIEWKYADRRGGGIDFLKQELLEFSVCPVGANANALVEGRAKSLGISRQHLAQLADAISIRQAHAQLDVATARFGAASKRDRGSRRPRRSPCWPK